MLITRSLPGEGQHRDSPGWQGGAPGLFSEHSAFQSPRHSLVTPYSPSHFPAHSLTVPMLPSPTLALIPACTEFYLHSSIFCTPIHVP